MEQGPVLDELGVPLAPVSAIAGQTRLSVSVSGSQARITRGAQCCRTFSRNSPMHSSVLIGLAVVCTMQRCCTTCLSAQLPITVPQKADC